VLGLALVTLANWAGVIDPAPAMARYNPSLSPMTTMAPPRTAPTSPTALSTKSIIFVSFMSNS
jgi:hypothetical protein